MGNQTSVCAGLSFFGFYWSRLVWDRDWIETEHKRYSSTASTPRTGRWWRGSLGVQLETPRGPSTSKTKLEKPNAQRLDLMKQEEGIITKKEDIILQSLLFLFFVVFISILLRWVLHNSVTVTVPHLFFIIAVGVFLLSSVFCLGISNLCSYRMCIWFENATGTYSKT